MSFNKSLIFVAALVALAHVAGAQTAPSPASPPAHHSLFGSLLHKHPPVASAPHPGLMSGMHMHGMHTHMAPGTQPGMTPGTSGGSMMPLAGGIIGNKKSHVYHLPGDKGALPSTANRVYFRTEQQALAAGYHAASSHNTPGGKMHKTHS